MNIKIIFNTLAKKLIIIYLAITMLTIIVVAVISYKTMFPEVMRVTKEHYVANAFNMINSINRIMNSNYEHIKDFANLMVFKSEKINIEAVADDLLRHKETYPSFKSISFFDMNRIRLTDTAGLNLGKQDQMVPYWERALEGKITSGEDIRISKELKIPIIYFASPVMNNHGKQIGVVVARYDPQDFNKTMKELSIDPRVSHVTLIDEEKNIFFSTCKNYNKNVLKEKISDLPSVREVLKGLTGSVIEDDPMFDHSHLTIYAPERGHEEFKGNNWSILISLDMEKVMMPFTVMRNRILVATTIIFLVVSVIIYFAVAKITKPLKKLRKGTEIVEGGNLDHVIDFSSKDEVGLLTESFNKMVKSLKKHTSDLKDLNREMESFSYSISHDLRAPLRAISGFSQALIEDYAGKLDEKGQDYLKRLDAASVNMGELIDDILTLSQMTRHELRASHVDLSALAQTIALQLKKSEPDRRVEFVIQKDMAAIGDANLIKIFLYNLLENAWKFTSKNDSAHIEFGSTTQNSRTIYCVRDNGVGFDMQYTNKLFIPFQRLHKPDEFPGTGIGLATVQRILSRHSGRIWGEAEVDRGAKFYFTIGRLGHER